MLSRSACLSRLNDVLMHSAPPWFTSTERVAVVAAYQTLLDTGIAEKYQLIPFDIRWTGMLETHGPNHAVFVQPHNHPGIFAYYKAPMRRHLGEDRNVPKMTLKELIASPW